MEGLNIFIVICCHSGIVDFTDCYFKSQVSK